LADREQSEREERVHALPVSRREKGADGIRRRLRVGKRVDRDPVVARQEPDDGGVASLLITLERNGLGEDRIPFHPSESLALHRGLALGPYGFVPDGQALQPREVLHVELGPSDVLRAKRTMRFEKGLTEKVSMLVRADLYGFHLSFQTRPKVGAFRHLRKHSALAAVRETGDLS